MLSQNADVSFETIRAWLVRKIAEELAVSEDAVKSDEPFSELGLGSRQAILITGDLEEFLGRSELDPTLLWDFPTIDKLARHLAG
jgi:acyl carrier protein